MTIAAIRTAVIELMQGSLGSTRKLSANVFQFGAFDGQPLAAQQTHSMDSRYRHRFDVQFGSARPHKATPISTKANYRIEARAVTIRVSTHLASSADESARVASRDLAEQDCSDAIGVLSYPGNLTATSAAVATSITSGMLVGSDDGQGIPRWELVSEDWKSQLLVSRILGVAIVNVSQ